MNIIELSKQALKEEIKEDMDRKQKLDAIKKKEANQRLRDQLAMKLGEDIAAQAVIDRDQVSATLPGISNAYFSCGSWYADSALFMVPILNVPDGDEFDEWWENPLNRAVPKQREITRLSSIADTLEQWQNCQWEIKPWPEKESELEQPQKPRFAELSIEQANQEQRPFEVHGVVTSGPRDDYECRLVIEYTDIYTNMGCPFD